LTPGFALDGGAAAGAPLLTQIREGDYLFFKNPDGAPFVQVKIDGDFHESKECATYSGFECLGKACQSRPIEPGGVVSLCFHHAGRFNVHILGPEPAVGVVEVVVR
jgi:hypothetical protein